MDTFTLGGISYTVGSKCPSCSSERDAGGRMEMKKSRWNYLKCDKCRYTIKTDFSRDRAEKREFHRSIAKPTR